MNEYCTLTELKRQLVPAGTTTDDTVLLLMLEDASRWLDKRTRHRFYPRVATRYYDYPAPHPALLVLDDDLLDLTTLTTENGAVTIVASDYLLLCGDNYNRTPYDRILLKDNGTQVTFAYSSSIQKSQAVTGMWGYREEYSEAWEDSLDDIAAGHAYTAGGTSIYVSDADGADWAGLTPRFQAGQTLLIDSEMFSVRGVNTTTNVLTVMGARNGTTAANHAALASIAIWRPMRDIFRATLDLAAWLYRQKDKQEGGAVGYPTLGITLNPDTLPVSVREVLKRYSEVSL